MALAERETLSDVGAPLETIHDLVAKIRHAVEGLVFTSSPASLGSVTQLLSTVPLDVCERLCDAAARLPAGEIARGFPAEDRLLIDMVRAMYDDLRVGTRVPRAG